MAREEATLAKFTSLSESIQNMAHTNMHNCNNVEAKTADAKSDSAPSDVHVPAPPKSTGLTTSDIKDLVDKLALMTSEVEQAHKRTSDAEKRTEELLAKERKLRRRTYLS